MTENRRKSGPADINDVGEHRRTPDPRIFAFFRGRNPKSAAHLDDPGGKIGLADQANEYEFGPSSLRALADL
jgi:hypothetical protein